MDTLLIILAFIAGAAITAIAMTLFHRDQRRHLLIQAETESQVKLAALQERLNAEREAMVEKVALLNEAQSRLTDSFKALSADALQTNNAAFLDLAHATLAKFQESARGDLEKRQLAIDQLVAPVKETLQRFDSKLDDMEKNRVGSYQALSEHIQNLRQTETQLRQETNNLVRALGTPRVRGKWGEMQLHRVVEMAGMLEQCDFTEQVQFINDEKRLRPDMIVHLPGGKNIVVDAKAPMEAYLRALETADEATRTEYLKEHARHIADHINLLGGKQYWDQLGAAVPEFVVLFIPGEIFFSAALEQDLTLIDKGIEKRVILATPTTLIALLKAVAYGWRQEKLAVNAQAISDLGRELYKRLRDMTGHLTQVGDRLDKAVESYNKAIGTLESRVLVTSRRFQELNAITTEEAIESPNQVNTLSRRIQAADLTDGEAERNGVHEVK